MLRWVVRATTLLARMAAEVWRDDLHERCISIDHKDGKRNKAASADIPLGERIASHDVTLERGNVVGELVEPLP